MMSPTVVAVVVAAVEADGRASLPQLEVLLIPSIPSLNRVSVVVRQPRSKVRHSHDQSSGNAKGSCPQ